MEPNVVVNTQPSDTTDSGISPELLSDIATYGERLLAICAAQRDARKQFFEELYQYALWRQYPISDASRGIAAKGDDDSKRWSAYLRYMFTELIIGGGICENDLPSKSETFEWYWLFFYRSELTPLVGETVATISQKGEEKKSFALEDHHVPSKRSHVRPLRKMFEDLKEPSERTARFRQMMNDGCHKGDNWNEPLSASFIKEWGVGLVSKPEPLASNTQHWRDLTFMPPQQSRVEQQLEVLRRSQYKQSVPPDVAKAIAAVIRTFADNRHLILRVDDQQRITSYHASERLTWGFMETSRSKMLAPRGRRKADQRKITIVKVEHTDAELPIVDSEEWGEFSALECASDYRTFKRFCSEQIGFPPPGKDDAITVWLPMVMPDAQAAQKFIAQNGRANLVSVPLIAVQRFVNQGLSIENRLWEDVADEVFTEALVLMDESTSEIAPEVAPEIAIEPEPLTQLSLLLDEAEAA